MAGINELVDAGVRSYLTVLRSRLHLMTASRSDSMIAKGEAKMSVKHYLDSFPGRNNRRPHTSKRHRMITVRMEPTLHQQFGEVAAMEKVSVNGLANALFQDYVAKKLPKPAA